MSGRSWRPRRRAAVGPPAEHEVTLVTRAGCHLCETAETELRTLAGALGFGLVVRDLDAEPDPAARARWADLVPVILVDGAEHGFWRVDGDRLRAAVGAA